MSAVLEALRVKLERNFWGDTASGGLANASSVAYCRGFYHAIRPSNWVYPHIFYRLISDSEDSVTTAGVRTESPNLRIEMEIVTRMLRIPLEAGASYVSGSAHNFGFGLQAGEGTIAAVMARLVTMMTTTGNWNSAETVGGSPWFFSKPILVGLPVAERFDEDHVMQRLSWSIAAFNSSVGPPITGSTFVMNVKEYDSVNGLGATILAECMITGYDCEQIVDLVDDTRALDIFDRHTTAGKRMTADLDFVVAPGSSLNFPIIPAYDPLPATATNKLVRLQITAGTSKVITTYGRITRLRVRQYTKTPRVRGSLKFVAASSTQYGDSAVSPVFGPDYAIG